MIEYDVNTIDIISLEMERYSLNIKKIVLKVKRGEINGCIY